MGFVPFMPAVGIPAPSSSLTVLCIFLVLWLNVLLSDVLSYKTTGCWCRRCGMSMSMDWHESWFCPCCGIWSADWRWQKHWTSFCDAQWYVWQLSERLATMCFIDWLCNVHHNSMFYIRNCPLHCCARDCHRWPMFIIWKTTNSIDYSSNVE